MASKLTLETASGSKRLENQRIFPYFVAVSLDLALYVWYTYYVSNVYMRGAKNEYTTIDQGT